VIGHASLILKKGGYTMIIYVYNAISNDVWACIPDVIGYGEDYHFSSVSADAMDYDNLHGL